MVLGPRRLLRAGFFSPSAGQEHGAISRAGDRGDDQQQPMACATAPVMLAFYCGVTVRVVSGEGGRGDCDQVQCGTKPKKEPGMLAGLCDAILCVRTAIYGNL
jgi:hypothetical protein